MAAVLACGPEAVLSYRDGAALWTVRYTARPQVDVTAPTRSRAPAGITLHRGRLHPEDRTIRDGIPVTSLARTLLDLASLLSLDAVVRALEEAERKRLIDMRSVYATLGDATLLDAGYRTLRVTGHRLEREPEAIARSVGRLL
jgi:hypothetical protein